MGHDFSRIPVQRRSLADVPVFFPRRSASDSVGTDSVGQEGRSCKSPFVDVSGLVAHGLGGAGAPLPYLDRIQSSFGCHDVTGVRAHLGPEAADANRWLGSEAYTSGFQVAFAGLPSLHTAAHEAAHVVQQRRGVSLKNNVGEPGDPYEKHADRVADLVVQGARAEPLLDQMAMSATGHSTGAAGTGVMQNAQVQMQEKPKSPISQKPPEIPGFREMISKWASIDKIKSPMMRALAKEYVNRPGRIRSKTPPEKALRATSYINDKVRADVDEPTEERVFNVLMSSTDLKKIGKGDKPSDWSFRWLDEPATEKKKTAGEQAMETGKFAAEQAVSKAIDRKYAVNDAAKYSIERPYITKQLIYSAYQKSAANLGVVGAEYSLTGSMSASSVMEAISEPVARWIMKDVLVVSAEVATKAIPVIGWIWLVYDVADLLISLNSSTESELSPYQEENANIIAGVKAYLERKEQAAELQEALKKPFNPSKYSKPLQNDATVVRLR